MRNSAEFFEGLYGCAAQPVWVYTEQGEPIFANRAANVLFRRMKSSAEALYEQIAEDAAHCLREQAGCLCSITADQEQADLFLSPYFYQDAIYLVVRVEEVSARYLKKDLLRILRNSGAKMNTYLNGIYGTAQRLGLESEEGERLGKDVHRILRIKNHLYQLLDRSGTNDYLAPIELGAYVKEFMRSALEIKPDLSLRLVGYQPDLYARMMPEDMETILSVLLSNAYRFGEGEILFSVGAEGARVFIKVMNYGSGPEEPDRLFEWGYRTADVNGARGLGFGLAMAKQMLENQGASLEYERLGDQTCFTIWMDAAGLPAGSVLAEWVAEPVENSLSQLRIELSDIL